MCLPTLRDSRKKKSIAELSVLQTPSPPRFTGGVGLLTASIIPDQCFHLPFRSLVPEDAGEGQDLRSLKPVNLVLGGQRIRRD